MSKPVTYHVMPSKHGGWHVKGEHAKRSSAKCDTKAEAVSRGKEIAKSKNSAQIVVHKKDGTIQTEHTYGKDPCPPRCVTSGGKGTVVRGDALPPSPAKAGKKTRDGKRQMTARDLLESGLVGIWEDRKDIGNSQSFARKLRERAQSRSLK